MAKPCKHCWENEGIDGGLCERCQKFPRCRVCTRIMGVQKTKKQPGEWGICTECYEESINQDKSN